MARHNKRPRSQDPKNHDAKGIKERVVRASSATEWLVGPVKDCKIQPGTWQPGQKPVVHERPVIILPEISPADIVEFVDADEMAVDEAVVATETIVPSVEPEHEYGPDTSLWTERPPFDDEPILFTHGPDPFEPVVAPAVPEPVAPPAPAPYADYPFEDMVLFAEQLGDEEVRIRNACADNDPDLRALAVLAVDSTAMTHVALGDIDGAKEAASDVRIKTEKCLDTLRVRLAKPVVIVERPPLSEPEQRAAAIAYLGRTVASFTEQSLALRVSASELDELARSVSLGYLRTRAAWDALMDRLSDAWRPLSVAVLFYQAQKPDASQETLSSFRAVADRVLAEEKNMDEAREANESAVERIHKMHATWMDSRNRAQEIRQKFHSVRAACQVFDVLEGAFAKTLEAGIETCDRALEDMDGAKALVAFEPLSCPNDIARVQSQFPQIRELLARLSQRGASELGSMMLMAYHVAVPADGRSNGRTPQVVAKMLHRGGVIAESEIALARDAIKPELERLFNKSVKGRFTLYVPNALGRTVATGWLSEHSDATDFEAKILEARRVINAEQRQAMLERIARKKAANEAAAVESDEDEEAC